jgi:photosystem II stability/assembly factor-like uncharacterized protein
MPRLLILLLLPTLASAQKEYVLDTLRMASRVHFRGLSVVNDRVIWICGNGGFVCRSEDGGQTFDTMRVAGFETSDFRDIEAFDDRTAVVMAAGAPAVILRTADGGRKWKTVFRDDRPEVFLNGMDFWDDKRGLAFSDPVDRKLLLLATANGGASWKEMPYRDRPQVQDGENGFAASGTSLRAVGEGHAFIGTGGRAAHVFTSADYGKTWSKKPCPVRKGKTAGIFSLAFKDARTGVIIGGDYENDTASAANCLLTYNGGANWKPPLVSPRGYRSCVEYINQTTLVATGPTGTDYSRDGGNTWKPVSSAGFNVVRKARKGQRIFLAGGDGLVGIITPY